MPTGAATNSPAAASSMNALKLCAATVLVRVSVETTKLDSRTPLCIEKRSARPDHRKEEGADTQGLMAVQVAAAAAAAAGEGATGVVVQCGRVS